MICARCKNTFTHTDHPNCKCDFCDKCEIEMTMRLAFYGKIDIEEEVKRKVKFIF